jgi:hypothetical protein
MANRKGAKESREQKRPPAKHMSEKSPNPHGESKILEMPIRTDQSKETEGRNIPQTPNTVGGGFNPSVAHEFESRVVSHKIGSDKSARASRHRKEKA